MPTDKNEKSVRKKSESAGDLKIAGIPYLAFMARQGYISVYLSTAMNTK
ncbi:MAG: hypothetical protein ACU85E_11885 [Gammaproteobacteria bacterium]